MRTSRRPRVVFCDWHGVLSHSLYWRTITENADHPAYSILRDELSRLFATGNADGRDWMRRRLSTHEILTRVTEHHPHLDIDNLCAQLADDITAMPVDQPLLHALARARDQAAIVLATDNITDFATAFHTHATMPGPTVDDVAATLRAAATGFDALLCSSTLGVFKRDDPTEFFGHGSPQPDSLSPTRC
ncbi:hypothetical protein [Nocardia higoensis]|uniref:hypothetical protein n=1 Tax=Nocardia higoensis TaxID=228599 RepID=UPI0002EAF8B7|nr:hypothetical protein [Nocardia higoensis]